MSHFLGPFEDYLSSADGRDVDRGNDLQLSSETDYNGSRYRDSSSNLTCLNGSASRNRDRSTTDRLNRILYHLNDIFPDAEVELLRQLMVDNNGSSQLYAIVEMLLSSPNMLSNRRRVRHAYVADWERFRTKEYRVAVTRVLRSHFSSLHRSTISNVLKQNNYCFSRSFDIIEQIALQRAGRWTFLQLFRKRRPLNVLDIPSLIGNTGSRELDMELLEVYKPTQELISSRDEKAARKINEEQYAELGQLIECECCFGDYAWEDLACCSEGHFFCRDCLTNVVKEGLFGQGGLRGKNTVRCISAAASPQCEAPISTPIVRASLPAQLYAEFERAQVIDYFSKNANSKGYVICPFCTYCEESAAAVVGNIGDLKFAISFSTILKLIGTCGPAILCLLLALIVAIIYTLLSTIARLTIPRSLYAHTFTHIDKWCEKEVTILMRGVFKKRHGTAFYCKNPECMRISCTECHKEFLPFHKCFEQEEDRMRIFIEKAMADAIKRTCPQCHISFIKSEGCNKLVCVCGYAMCYVCRRDICDEGYQHFCEHFRPIPGRACTECDKCDLYKVEDESLSIARAAKQAEQEFIQTNGIPTGLEFSGKSIGPGGHEIATRNPVLRAIETLYISIADVIIAE